MVRKGIAIIGGALAALGGIILLTRAKAISPLVDPALTPAEAASLSIPYLDSIVEDITEEKIEKVAQGEVEIAEEEIETYISDPTLVDQVEQAKQTIDLNAEQGISPAEDPGAAIFSGQLDAYKAYVTDGGTASFDDFTLYGVGMTPEYQVIIDASKQAFYEREADAVIEIFTLTDSAGVPIGGMHPNLEGYLDMVSADVKEELLTRPEVQEALELPTPIEPESIAPTTPTIIEVPDEFTASVDQLDELVASGVSQDSPTYEAAVDTAYEQAAAVAAETGDVVTWTPDEGYYAASVEEVFQSHPDSYWVW